MRGCMKLKSYKSLLQMGKDKINSLLVPVRTNRAKKQFELELAKLEEDLATAEAGIQEEATKADVNSHNLIERLDKHALLERKQKQFQKILSEMFPE